MNNELSGLYKRVFGEKFSLSASALTILIIAGDLVMLLAEGRVFQVGYTLTGSRLLAIGFVAVSSVPFYLGQLAYIYKRANGWQIATAVGLVGMGLLVSAYYGFADYLIQTNTVIAVSESVSFSVDVQSLYFVAVAGTVTFIIACLFYTLVDTEIANKLKMNRMEGRAAIAIKELELRERLLVQLTGVANKENELKGAYGAHYEQLLAQMNGTKTNPTTGDGKK